MVGIRSFGWMLVCVGLMAGCGDDDEPPPYTGSGGSGGAVDGGTGATGGSVGGSGGTTASGGRGGTGGAGGSAGSGGGGGTGGGGCIQLTTFADGKSPTATLHVQGGATGGDGSSANPFGTLAQAQSAATPGTEIRVQGEVTNDAELGFTGTADAPIWITGEPGAKLVGGQAPAMWMTNSSHVVVRDLELTESSGHVLHVVFSDHILLQRLHVHRGTLACLKSSQSTHLYVEDCDFHGAGAIPGGNPASTQVFDLVGVNTGHIVRSKFHDAANVMVMLKGGTSDMFFAFNEIYDQTSDSSGAALHLGQSTGPQFFQPQDADYEGLRIVAFANLVHDVAGPPFAFQGCVDCAGVHNTLFQTTGGQLVRYLPGEAGAQSGQTSSTTRGSRFTGNIVVGGRADGASLNADQQSVGAGNGLDHNVFLKPGALNWWGVLDQETATSTYDQDPQLDGQGVPGNVALVDGKGATDLGGLPFSEHFQRDYAGRCVTAPLDIGAIDVP